MNYSVTGTCRSRFQFDLYSQNDSGIRCHNKVTAFFLKCLGKIQDVTLKGKVVHLNANSFKKWTKKQEVSYGKAPSTNPSEIVKFYYNARKSASLHQEGLDAFNRGDFETCELKFKACLEIAVLEPLKKDLPSDLALVQKLRAQEEVFKKADEPAFKEFQAILKSTEAEVNDKLKKMKEEFESKKSHFAALQKDQKEESTKSLVAMHDSIIEYTKELISGQCGQPYPISKFRRERMGDICSFNFDPWLDLYKNTSDNKRRKALNIVQLDKLMTTFCKEYETRINTNNFIQTLDEEFNLKLFQSWTKILEDKTGKFDIDSKQVLKSMTSMVEEIYTETQALISSKLQKNTSQGKPSHLSMGHVLKLATCFGDASDWKKPRHPFVKDSTVNVRINSDKHKAFVEKLEAWKLLDETSKNSETSYKTKREIISAFRVMWMDLAEQLAKL